MLYANIIYELFEPVIRTLGHLIAHFGLLGLLISSFIGSTIFVPFSVEAGILFLIGARVNPFLVIIVASIGAFLGTCVNYWLGFYGSGFVEKRIGAGNIDKAKRIMNKYGWPGLFLIIFLPTPIPVDPITIIPGLTRMNFVEFSIVVFLAKLARYAALVGLLSGLFNTFNFYLI